jgi:hypothetical protein
MATRSCINVPTLLIIWMPNGNHLVAGDASCSLFNANDYGCYLSDTLLDPMLQLRKELKGN